MTPQDKQFSLDFDEQTNFSSKIGSGFAGQLFVYKEGRTVLVMTFTGLESPTVQDFYSLMNYLEKLYSPGVTFEYIIY